MHKPPHSYFNSHYSGTVICETCATGQGESVGVCVSCVTLGKYLNKRDLNYSFVHLIESVEVINCA